MKPFAKRRTSAIICVSGATIATGLNRAFTLFGSSTRPAYLKQERIVKSNNIIVMY